ncbi:hypothetical protein AUH73_05255 [archaeon 13_1_40CM_4_53_4]|nr:MAG: hypothetical protein AUI07_02390 [archaeon 13_2_20CM_2_53_6]OLC62195.1 MAG: hypothetical protein AUH73_05255 [archaeon 13_1_40CM_4_53_4]OLE59826.1 MAG: hypothetical protein AUG17_01070 [Crenarchaeota archaeon 13_1_20CM_2_53_14]
MRLLRNGDRVTVRVAKWDDPKISRRVEAVINTNSIVSKIPAKTWKELDVKPAFKHWQTQKPADLVLFELRGHRASDSVIATKGRASLSLLVLTSVGYWEDPETGWLH